jgi:hypothetical protein
MGLVACRLVEGDHCFRGTCCLNCQSSRVKVRVSGVHVWKGGIKRLGKLHTLVCICYEERSFQTGLVKVRREKTMFKYNIH